jgi:sec-independent protein translocase protein TatC
LIADDPERSLWAHLDDLRSALIKTGISILITGFLAFLFSDSLFSLLTEALPPDQPLALFSPQEGLVTLFKLAFWGGLLLAMPYWLGIWVKFLAPALRGRELTLIPLFLLFSLIFVSAGIVLGLRFTLPVANHYLYSFNQSLGMNLWSVAHYFDYVWLLLLAHIVAFETGAVMLCLVHIGVLKWQTLAGLRRQALVGSLIVGALLTPPDVLTQLAIAAPLYAFFELAILYGKLRSTSQEYGSNHSDHVDPNRASTPQSNSRTPPEDL